MATYVETAHKVFVAGLDVSCFVNQMALDLSADVQEPTNFCSGGWRERRQGLRGWTSVFDGFADFAAAANTASPLVPGEILTPANIGSQQNCTWSYVGTEGVACYLSDGVLSSITPLAGSVGDLAAIHGELVPADVTVAHKMVRGLLEANRTVSSSSNTTGTQLGAVAAGKRIYASLHVFTLSGTSPTLDVVVQSDNASNFPSPSDRITFTQATTRSGQFGSAAGAITDDYWRVKWTIGGSGSPTAAFAVSIGIL